MGVSIAEINNTMRIAWGGSYINDFVDRGRVKKFMFKVMRAAV